MIQKHRAERANVVTMARRAALKPYTSLMTYPKI